MRVRTWNWQHRLALRLLAVFLVGGCLPRRVVRFTLPTENGGVRLRPLVDALVGSGLLASRAEISQVPFTFLVLDSLGKPMANAGLVVRYAEEESRYSTDELGQVSLCFEAADVERNPLIAPTTQGQVVSFRFAITREMGTAGNVTVVDADTLLSLAGDGFRVYYARECSLAARQLVALKPAMRRHIADITGLEPIGWGTVLVPAPLPLVLKRTRVHEGERAFNLVVFSTSDATAKEWYLTNVHEWTEQTIIEQLGATTSTARWVTDGIAEFAKFKFLRRRTDMLPDEVVSAGIRELEAIADYLKSAEAEGTKELRFDLLSWHRPTPLSPLSERDVLGYRCALWFWWEEWQRHGDSLVPQFLAEVTRPQPAETDRLLSVLAGLTDDRRADIENRLRRFKVAAIRAEVDSLLLALRNR